MNINNTLQDYANRIALKTHSACNDVDRVRHEVEWVRYYATVVAGHIIRLFK